MAGGLPTLSTARKRFQYLRDETDYSTTDAIIDSHLDAAQKDVLNATPFSWNVATTTGSLSSGAFSLATDCNPRWGLLDARIVASGTNDDSIFKPNPIPITDRDSYSTSDYVWWRTYDTVTSRHKFNTPTQSGTVTYYYFFLPDTLTATTDTAAQAITLIVPDAELIALLALSKFYIGRSQGAGISLSHEFLQQADARLKALQIADAMFGEQYTMQSVISDNPGLSGGRRSTDLVIGTP